LTFHAHYACRHSGACCTAGWSIPVEPRLLPLIGVDLLVPDAAGACTHFDGASRLCKIQREHGENMLPGACYQFPRRALIDDRGTFVALSNFCPTAAALLCESDGELAIVPSPPAFPEDRVYEGLDARGHWPPLVRPGVLFDLASYSRWETFIVSTFASGAPAGTALARIAATAERLRAWIPACGPFDSWVTRSLHPAATDSKGLTIYDRFRAPEAFEQLRRFVPDGLTAPQPVCDVSGVTELGSTLESRAVNRYLASKAFASWCAYESRGIRTLVAELFLSELVLRVECERASRAAGRAPFDARNSDTQRRLDRSLMIEAIRQSDLLLMHLIDRRPMIEWLGQVETFTTMDTKDTKADYQQEK
jgi:hypothetical protein